MKLTAILLLAACLQVSAGSYGQKRVTLTATNAPLKKVFTEIRKQTGYVFFVNESLLQQARPVTMKLTDADLEAALDLCLKDQQLAYSIVGNNIVIERTNITTPVKAEHTIRLGLIDIHGRIVNEHGEPVVASVVVKGTDKGTATNNNGLFEMTLVDEKAILIITAANIETREIKVNGQKDLGTIIVKIRISPLDETQVIAYGTTTKRMNAGDITTITAEEIQKNPVNNVLEAIQAKVPGLFVQQVTGQPGGAFNLRLRTSANFASDAPQPLIVVDGVTYPGGTLPLNNNTLFGTANFLKGGSGLNYLNPNDIESINVLKDADATALYGSSGAYGVIIITTKKAKAGPPTLNANIYTGISVLGQQPELMNTQQYLMLRREALANDGLSPGADDKDINGTWPEDRYNDFRDDLLGSYAQNTNVNVSYSGGVQNTNYLISGSLRNHGNIQRHNGANRDGSLRFSLNSSALNNKFNISLSGTYLTSTNDMVPFDFSSSVVFAAPNAPPIFLPDGSINWSEGANDLADDVARIYKNVTNNFLASANLSYSPVKKLTLSTVLSYNVISGRENIAYPTTAKPPTYVNAAQETHSIFHHYENRSITISPYAEFNTTIAGKGSLNVTAGGKVDNRLSYYNDIEGVGFPSDALLSSPASGTTVTTTYSYTPYRYIGFHTAAKFIWDQKYILSLNGRRDGSTRFGSGKKFGNFGSAALAWIFSEENLIKENLPFISFGKLRGSTGVIGGDAVRDFAYLSTYTVVNGTYQNKVGLLPGGLANPNLQWEKNKNSELGLELGFFHDRIYAEVNYYNNIASNQLVSRELSYVTGFGAYALNSDAVIQTWGWEMVLNSTNIKKRDFTWSTRFNISIPKSKLKKLPSYVTLNGKYILDKPVTGIILYKYEGINPETGDYSFTNADGTTDDFFSGLSEEDKTEFIDLAPKYYGAFQNSVRYRQWTLDFTVSFTSRIGKNYLAQTSLPFGYVGVNGGTLWLDRWQKTGDITDVPKVGASFISWFRHWYFQESTGAYSDATYARLQNVSLRYRLEEELLKKLRLKDLTFYLQGQNLLTISRFGRLDPENLDAATIPPMQVFTAGVNVTL